MEKSEGCPITAAEASSQEEASQEEELLEYITRPITPSKTMNESLDWVRTLGVNGGVLAVTLTDVELALKVTLLVVTIAWTVVKILDLLNNKDDDKK